MKNIDFERIFSSIPEGIYILNKDAKIIYWNQEAENILGFTENEVLGKSCSDNIIMHCDSKNNKLCNTDKCIYRKIMKNSLSIRQQYNYAHHRSGEKIILETTAFPYYDKRGEISGIIEIFHKVDPKTVSEISYSKKFMNKILPKGTMNFDRIRIFSKYIPRSFIGGDFYNFFKNDNQIIFWFGDCESEGVSASLISVMLNSIISMKKQYIKIDNLSKIMADINNDFCDISENSVSASMILGVFDCKTGKITYTNAGHPEIIHYSKKKDSITLYSLNSFLLGFAKNSSFQIKTIDTSKNDLIFMFSDGAYEFKISKDDYFSIEGLTEIIESSIHSSEKTDEILENCVDRLSENNFETNFLDDFTMCMMEIK